ncbi:MAG: hypothetical protein M3441_24070 [Chloroflexota bacterium]|nr:hypothetical protein [Chloroflexota bacterium]
MSTPYVPTESESDLLDTARRVLGVNLSGFLLSGLGEPHHPRRLYTARSVRAHGPGLTFRLEAVSDSEKGLPGGRDPLVMAALLHLLWTGDRGKDEVVFRDEELFERLSWADTWDARITIEGAVERYYCTAYRRTSTEPMGAGGGERRSSQVQKLVTAYETTLELLSGPPKETRKSTVVQFMPKLVEEVTGAEKYFLGIDFERLRLEPLPPDSSAQS